MTVDLWGRLDTLLADEAKDYEHNPKQWIAERLGEETWSKQDEVLQALQDHRRVAVRSCHGVGKSHIAARAAAHWIDSHPPGEAFVVSTAPTWAQVRAILWRYIRQAWKKNGLIGKVTEACEWKIEGDLVGYGRKPADHDESAFQGIHARYVLVIIDEACGIPEQLWVAADALTTNDDCRILAIGNPDDPGSHFAKVCRSKLWHQIRISAFDSPNLTGEKVSDGLRKLLISQNWAEEKLQEWGKDNPLYLSKVLGEFPPDNPYGIVRLSDVQRCREFEIPRTPAELEPVVLGVDIGSGGDETAIRERRGIVAGREWTNRLDRPEEVAESILQAIIETGATKVNVDADGIGWGVVGHLRLFAQLGRHNATIFGIRAGLPAQDPKRFANIKAEIWWEVGRVQSEKRLWDLSRMDNADDTIAQLCMPLWDLTPTGQIRVEKKEDVRARLGRSPDNADALLYAFYGGGAAQTQSFLDQLVAGSGDQVKRTDQFNMPPTS